MNNVKSILDDEKAQAEKNQPDKVKFLNESYFNIWLKMIKPIDASDKITLTRGLKELGVSVPTIGSFLDELDDQKTALFICPKSFCHYWFKTDQSIKAYIGNTIYEGTDVKQIAARVFGFAVAECGLFDDIV